METSTWVKGKDTTCPDRWGCATAIAEEARITAKVAKIKVKEAKAFAKKARITARVTRIKAKKAWATAKADVRKTRTSD